MADSKNVVVIMSFGGSDKSHNRASIIDFLRVKHIIGNLAQVEHLPGIAETRVKYDITRAELEVGDIPNKAKEIIYAADIVVAILSERNLNVIYELAFRFELKGQCIILIRGKPEELLPIYVKDQAYFDLESNLSEVYRAKLAEIAAADKPHLDFRDPVPLALAKLIEQYDTNLAFFLQHALARIEEGIDNQPGSADLVPGLDIGHNLSAWTTYYPYNVVRVGWKRRSRPLGYELEDVLDEPIVYAANQDYFQMFGLSINAQTFRHQQHLSLARLLERLDELRCVEPHHLERLKADQGRLFREIVLNQGLARAEAPLAFNEKHPCRDFRGAAFLPTLVAMCVPGDCEQMRERPHFSYFIVVFVEQPTPEVI